MAVLMSDGRIGEPSQSNGPGMFLAFRPFFLSGALFSVLALVLWASLYTGQVSLSVYGGGYWWHAHEMLFGFVCAIVVGFLLTAVQTWTGMDGVRGWRLLALYLVWLAARIAFLLPALLPVWVPALLDMLFLPLAALLLAIPILQIKQWRNMVFLPVLLAMCLANGLFHRSALNHDSAIQALAASFMVMLVTLLMTVVAESWFRADQ